MKHSQTYQKHYSTIVKPLDYAMSASINQMIYNVDVLELWNRYKKAIMFYRKQLLTRFNDTYTRNSITNKQRNVMLNGYFYRYNKRIGGKVSDMHQKVTKVYLDDTCKIALTYMYCAYCLTNGELTEIERKELVQTKYYEAIKTTYAKYPNVKA